VPMPGGKGPSAEMVTPRLRTAWALAVAGCATIALVSGTVFVIASAVGSDGDDAGDTVTRSWQRSIAWPVGVRRTSDPRTAVVAYDVPAGQPDCFRRPQVKVAAETADSVSISLTYEIGRLDCTLTARNEIRVATQWVLKNRSVVVNGEAWAPGRTSSYRRCGNDGCTPPPPPQCGPGRVDESMRAIDAAGDREVRACTARWLIADVTGAGPPRRWFFEYRDRTWHPLLGTRNEGCSAVRDSAADFPEALCRDLPVPG
jgi:hypothetical protein